MNKATLYFCMAFLGLTFQANAAGAQYFLKCTVDGDLIKIADVTVPAKSNPSDSILVVTLPMEAINLGSSIFYTTGSDYFVRVKVRDQVLSIYLHSAGYTVPFKKSTAFSLHTGDGRYVNILSADIPENGFVSISAKVLAAFGMQGLEHLDEAFRVSCENYGG